MIKKSIFFSFVFFLLLTIITPITHTAEQTVFGPKSFEIGRWHLHISRHSFSVDIPGEGNLVITKITPEKAITVGFLFLIDNRQYITAFGRNGKSSGFICCGCTILRMIENLRFYTF